MAGEAVQRSSAEGLVRMNRLVAQLLLTEGPARLSADGGIYDLEAETVAVNEAAKNAERWARTAELATACLLNGID